MIWFSLTCNVFGPEFDKSSLLIVVCDAIVDQVEVRGGVDEIRSVEDLQEDDHVILILLPPSYIGENINLCLSALKSRDK